METPSPKSEPFSVYNYQQNQKRWTIYLKCPSTSNKELCTIYDCQSKIRKQKFGPDWPLPSKTCEAHKIIIEKGRTSPFKTTFKTNIDRRKAYQGGYSCAIEGCDVKNCWRGKLDLDLLEKGEKFLLCRVCKLTQRMIHGPNFKKVIKQKQSIMVANFKQTDFCKSYYNIKMPTYVRQELNDFPEIVDFAVSLGRKSFCGLTSEETPFANLSEKEIRERIDGVVFYATQFQNDLIKNGGGKMPARSGKAARSAAANGGEVASGSAAANGGEVASGSAAAKRGEGVAIGGEVAAGASHMAAAVQTPEVYKRWNSRIARKGRESLGDENVNIEACSNVFDNLSVAGSNRTKLVASTYVENDSTPPKSQEYSLSQDAWNNLYKLEDAKLQK